MGFVALHLFNLMEDLSLYFCCIFSFLINNCNAVVILIWFTLIVLHVIVTDVLVEGIV